MLVLFLSFFKVINRENQQSHDHLKSWTLFAITFATYIAAPLITYFTKNYIIVLPTLFLALTTAYGLFEFTRATFQDDYKFKNSTIFKALVFGATSFFFYSFTWQGIWPAEYHNRLIGIIPCLMSISISIYAIYLIHRDTQNDMVEDRIRQRKIAFFSLSCIVILITTSEIMTITSRVPIILELIIQALTWVGFIYYSYIQIVDRVKKQVLSKVIKEQKKNEFQELERDYRSFVEQSEFFIDEEITLTSLSAKLGYPEYLVRRYINQELGYRNFKHFINSLRISKACEILKENRDEKQNYTEIALRVGFGSQSTFNRSFKSIFNLSPSQFVKELQ